MHRWIAFLFALALGVAPPLIGQARDSLSLDVTVGPNSGAGGRRPYYNSGGISGEVTLAFRAHPARTLAHVEAISLGRRTAMEFGDPCRIVPGEPGCAPAFPSFGHLAALAGFEWRASRVAGRALAGPALYYGGGPTGAGGQFQLDAAVGFTHLALVVAARVGLISRFTGETLRDRSLEFGLRLQ